MIIICLLVCYFCWWKRIIKPTKSIITAHVTKDSVYYLNKTLHLNQQSKLVESNIVLKRFYKSGASYKPAELVYSGMTVGGISVGSAKVNEAHYETYGIKTNKFLMYYMNENKPIEKIVCSFDIPKNSPVSKFCANERTIIIKSPSSKKEMSDVEKSILAKSMRSGDRAMEYAMIYDHIEEGLLTLEECKIIKSFIGGSG